MARETDALAKVPLFSDLSQRHLRHVAKATVRYDYQDGAHVVEEGGRGESFFVVLGGRAKAVRRGRTVGRFGPGDFFGEIALLDGGPRTATVVAEGPLSCLVLTRSDFRQVVSQEPGVGPKVLQGAARRLREIERASAT